MSTAAPEALRDARSHESQDWLSGRAVPTLGSQDSVLFMNVKPPHWVSSEQGSVLFMNTKGVYSVLFMNVKATHLIQRLQAPCFS